MFFKKIFKIFFLVGMLMVQHALFSMMGPEAWPTPQEAKLLDEGVCVVENKKPAAGVAKRFVMRPVLSRGQALVMAQAVDSKSCSWHEEIDHAISMAEYITVTDLPPVYRSEEPCLYTGILKVTSNTTGSDAFIIYCENRWERSLTVDHIIIMPQGHIIAGLLKTLFHRARARGIELMSVPVSLLTKSMKKLLIEELGFEKDKEALVYKAKK